MQADARTAIKSADGVTCIYLRGTPETLAARIAADDATSTERPDLTGLGGGIDEVRAVLAERAATYESVADHVIDVDTLSPQQVVDAIVPLVK